MTDIDPARLAALIADAPGTIDRALDKVHEKHGVRMPLDFIRATNAAKPAEFALIEYLEWANFTQRFVAAIAAMGEDIAPDAGMAARLAALRQDGFDFAGLETFAREAGAFRCRIRVNGEIKGSGVLVSFRFVLTAWHVVNREQRWGEDDPPRIEVMTSDGQVLAARPANPSSPCHPDEWCGRIPNDNELAGHDDYTLLRLSHPAGFLLGFARLTCPPPDWPGTISCLLVHYPLREDVGVTDGSAIFGDTRRRFLHTASSDAGSSGGALFSNTFELIGVHQKRVEDNRLFVPIRNFANDESSELVQALKRDRTPTYLWSLDGSLDGHIVIGRRTFFDALDRMLETGEVGGDRLRGIWMRRKRPEEDQSGLGFAFDLLAAFLSRRQPEAQVARIALQAGEGDLFKLVEAAFGGLQGASAARPGVRIDETTPVAFDADRAAQLVRRIEAQVPGPVWLYLDGPKDELSDDAVRQLEQLVSSLMRSERIRFVLTRMESHRLPLGRFDTLAEIGERSAPGVFYDYAGDFSREDLETTIVAASNDLGLALQEAAVSWLADQALRGVEPQFGLYPAGALSDVAARLVELLEPKVEAA